MPVNLNDWLGDHVWAWWLCLVVLCLAAAVIARRPATFAVALGPAVAAALAGVRPDWFWIQAASALVVSLVAGLVTARLTRRPDDQVSARRAA